MGQQDLTLRNKRHYDKVHNGLAKRIDKLTKRVEKLELKAKRK